LISDNQVYKGGYYTGFHHQSLNNAARATDNSYHIAYVDNYELVYASSTDSGQTWIKTPLFSEFNGNIRRAVLAVANDGAVHLCFNVHPYFQYADPTTVVYSKEFVVDMYCANNRAGNWSYQLVHAHEDYPDSSTGNHGASPSPLRQVRVLLVRPHFVGNDYQGEQTTLPVPN